MKELSIKEKARRYDESIEKAKKTITDYQYDEQDNPFMEVFPELREREDDRIRKNIISWLKNMEGQTIPIGEYNSAIAWLEKQGEQKSADKVEPKFREGEWITIKE